MTQIEWRDSSAKQVTLFAYTGLNKALATRDILIDSFAGGIPKELTTYSLMVLNPNISATDVGCRSQSYPSYIKG